MHCTRYMRNDFDSCFEWMKYNRREKSLFSTIIDQIVITIAIEFLLLPLQLLFALQNQWNGKLIGNRNDDSNVHVLYRLMYVSELEIVFEAHTRPNVRGFTRQAHTTFLAVRNRHFHKLPLFSAPINATEYKLSTNAQTMANIKQCQLLHWHPTP